jgi:hypothetical protein
MWLKWNRIRIELVFENICQSSIVCQHCEPLSWQGKKPCRPSRNYKTIRFSNSNNMTFWYNLNVVVRIKMCNFTFKSTLHLQLPLTSWTFTYTFHLNKKLSFYTKQSIFVFRTWIKWKYFIKLQYRHVDCVALPVSCYALLHTLNSLHALASMGPR